MYSFKATCIIKHFQSFMILHTMYYVTQNKGKESENSYRKLKSSQWTGTQTHPWKQNLNVSTDKAVLLNQKKANVCEQTTRMASLEFCACGSLPCVSLSTHKLLEVVSSYEFIVTNMHRKQGYLWISGCQENQQ